MIAWPGWVPAGISTSRSPSRVGASTAPPTIARVAGTSTTVTRSWPRRSKRSSSATADDRRRGRPAARPLSPACPAPAIRIRWPDSIPAGTSTSQVALAQLAPGAVAPLAGLLGDPAVAVAARAGPGLDELAEGACGGPAARARRRRRSRRCGSASPARRRCRGSARRPRPPRSATSRSAPVSTSASVISTSSADVAALGRAARARRRTGRRTASRRRRRRRRGCPPCCPAVCGDQPPRAQALVAEGVVGAPPLGVREHLVGLGRLLELLLGLGVVAVDVGVQVAGEAPKRLLDLRLARPPARRRAPRSSRGALSSS